MVISLSTALELRFYNATCQPSFAGPTAEAFDPTAISTNSWHQLVGVVNNSIGSLFVDGVQVASTTFTSKALSNLAIGRRSSGSYYWPGLINDVRIYNRPLSLAEIQALYNSGK
jgi:hypothetical protein